MTALTGLELRKAACEALGYWWEGGPSVGFWHTPKCCRPSLPGHDGCDFEGHPQRGFIEDALPAIESDPAVSEPMFLEWCEKKKYYWEIRGGGELPCECSIFDYEGSMEGCIVTASGSTLSEARARAIMEAGK